MERVDLSLKLNNDSKSSAGELQVQLDGLSVTQNNIPTADLPNGAAG